MNIGKRLALIRHARGLGIKEVVEKTGIGTYDKFETGSISPKLDHLITICELYDMKIWELVAQEFSITIKETD